MAISKLIFNGVTQMDVTQDTVAAAKLLSGETAHGADGEQLTGTLVPGVSPTFTATIKNAGNYANYIKYNNVTYKSVGSFTFTAGNIAELRAQGERAGGYIYVDGTQVAYSANNYATYNYTLPDHDIEVTFDYSGSYGYTKVIFPTLSITENDKYDVSDYYYADVDVPSIQVDSLSVTTNGTYTAQTGHAYSPVTVNVSGGGGSATKKQINFIDYDGTLLHSYTKAEINAMTSESDLPANPSHTGLTAQGWNWTLAEIKAQLTAVPDGDVWVGQMYITASGNTEIDVSMPEGRLSPILTIAVNGTITVDWGDNTTLDTVTGSSLTTREEVPHTYASPGDYTIVISVTSGKFTFYGSSSYLILRKNTNANEGRVYANCIQNIRLGSGITSIGNSAFSGCYSLANITIPDGVTSIGAEAFNNCSALASITIPDGVTSIISSAFNICDSLASVTIPNGVTSIGNSAFSGCYSLANITIPDGVTSIGSSAFYYCCSLVSITIPDSVTSISGSAFSGCNSLASITIPNGVTSTGTYAFQYCSALASVTIPDSVTSISSYAFQYCHSLASVTIPDSVTSISSSAFSTCYGMAEYHFLRTTPPTLGNTNAFNNIVSDCVMYVPYSADHSILEAYKTASNWSTYASYMQEEPQ